MPTNEFQNHLAGAIFESAIDAMFVLDLNRRVVMINASALQHLHKTEEEVIGFDEDAIFQPDQAQIAKADSRLVMESNSPHVVEETLRTYHGGIPEDRTYIISKFPLHDLNGKIIGMCCIFQDITERKQAETELRIAATAFESQEGMMVTDKNMVILRVNQAFTKITGYTAQESVGQIPRLLSSGLHDAAFYAEMRKSLLHNGSWQGEIFDRRKSGEVYPEKLTITAVMGAAGTISHFVSTLDDISDRKRVEKKIMAMAFYDTLTQLPNRRLFMDRLGKAMDRGARSSCFSALLFLSMDNVKQINDVYGHVAGDLLLVEVVHRIGSCVREEDTVARFGGVEFLVMLNELDMNKAEAIRKSTKIAEKLRATLAEPYLQTRSGNDKPECVVEHHCTSNIGVVLFFSHEASKEETLEWAEIAMYQAKEEGGNSIRFYEPKV